MYWVVFNYWQYWTISWAKVMYPGNSVPKICVLNYLSGDLVVRLSELDNNLLCE